MALIDLTVANLQFVKMQSISAKYSKAEIKKMKYSCISCYLFVVCVPNYKVDLL